PLSTRFPYTTLFRSTVAPRIGRAAERAVGVDHDELVAAEAGAIVLRHLAQLKTGLAQRAACGPTDTTLDEDGTAFAVHARLGNRSEEHTSELQSLRH